MRISKQRLQKIIKEELGYVLSLDFNKTKNLGHMYLFESKKRNLKPKRVKFELMMEQYHKGTISGDMLARRWTKSTLYELKRHEELLNELDWEKRSAEIEAGEVEGGGRYDPEGRPAPGMGAMAQRAGAEISSAMEKLNDWLIEKAVQATQLASTSWKAVKSAASALSDAAEKFKEKHPILYQIIKWIVVALVVFAIYKLTQGEAQATIKLPAGAEGIGGDDTIRPSEVNAMIGNLDMHLSSAMKSGDVDLAGKIGDLMGGIRDAHNSTGEVPLEKLGKFTELVWDQVNGLAAKGQAEGPGSTPFNLIMQWLKVGKHLTINGVQMGV